MALVPDTRNSIVVTKSFDYRGATKTWSNRYHFEGDLPSDQTAFEAFADLVVAAEKAIYDAGVTITDVTCYDASTATATNPHGDAVYSKAYTTVGTGDFTSGGTKSPGDCAIYVRYGTPARSAKNHPIYLANYYHGCWQATGDHDSVNGPQHTAVDTYAGHWLTGFNCDGSPRERCGPRGAVATSKLVDTKVRHRDFPA